MTKLIIVSAVALTSLAGLGWHLADPAEPGNAVNPFPEDTLRSAMMDNRNGELTGEEPKIKERRSRIIAELATLTQTELKETEWAKEWAGQYYTGDGLGENVSIHLAPQSGISFLNYGCMGLYGADHGDVVGSSPGELKLKLKFGSAKQSFLSERIFLIKWGTERFLVPDWQMKEFVNNYNKGGYSKSSMFGIARLIKDGNPHRFFAPASGRPQLPEPYAQLLRDTPLSLKVRKVIPGTTEPVTGPVSVQRFQVEFEGGTDQGVYVKMEFPFPREEFADRGEFRVIRTDATSCLAEFTSYSGKKITPPAIGDVLLTTEADVDFSDLIKRIKEASDDSKDAK